jgi:serine/threonine-protein kinase
MPAEPVDQPDGAVSLPDRFSAGEPIGRSASASVYRAHDRALDRQVAVKLLPAGPDPLTLRRAEREGGHWPGLSHPGLVSILESGVHQDRPYLVMQLISGQILQSGLLARPLPEAASAATTPRERRNRVTRPRLPGRDRPFRSAETVAPGRR